MYNILQENYADETHWSEIYLQTYSFSISSKYNVMYGSFVRKVEKMGESLFPDKREECISFFPFLTTLQGSTNKRTQHTSLGKAIFVTEQTSLTVEP